MAIYYVRPTNGSDGNAGTSYGAAFQTTQKAVDTAVAGDTVILCAEAVELITAKIDLDTNAGTAVAPIRIVAANSSGTVDGTAYTIRANATITAVLDFAVASDNTVWTGVDLDGDSKATYTLYNNVDGSDFHRFNNCRFRRATSHGICVRGAGGNGWVLSGCESYSNGGAGVAHSAANRGYILWYGGKIHHNSSHGWLVDSVVSVYGCQIYRNGGDGLNGGSNASGLIIVQNTIYLNSGDGIELYNATSRAYYHIINNSIVSNGNYGIRFQAGDSDTALVFDHNHTHGNSSGASDLTLPGYFNVTGDPLFTATTDNAENFTPASNSPLVGAGFGGLYIGALPAPTGGSGRFGGINNSFVRRAA